MKSFRILFIVMFFFSCQNFFAQRGHRRIERRTRTVVVHRSLYRPRHVHVYRPHWRPSYAYHRRWVYFPHYNIYWDNWRNQYVFLNGTVWVSQAAPPPVIINVNLEKEKSVELNESEDDVDDIYKTNDVHQKGNPDQ